MTHFFTSLVTLLTVSNFAFASFSELSCERLIDYKTQVTNESDTLQFNALEMSYLDEGMKTLLTEAKVPNNKISRYNNIHLELKISSDTCKFTSATNWKCQSGPATLYIKAKEYKHGNERFDNYSLDLSRVSLQTTKSKVSGKTLVSFTLGLESNDSGNAFNVVQKYHLFKVEYGKSASCTVDSEFEVL